jgi:hypothetical protein
MHFVKIVIVLLWFLLLLETVTHFMVPNGVVGVSALTAMYVLHTGDYVVFIVAALYTILICTYIFGKFQQIFTSF